MKEIVREKFQKLLTDLNQLAAEASEPFPAELPCEAIDASKADELAVQIRIDATPYIDDMTTIAEFFSKESLSDPFKDVGVAIFDFLNLLVSGSENRLVVTLPAAADTGNDIVRLACTRDVELVATAIRAGKIDSYIGHEFPLVS